MKRWFSIFIVILMCLCSSGCSVFMAAQKPSEKNLHVIGIGMPRSALLEELGQPASTEIKNGLKVDTFLFDWDGWGPRSNVRRALAYGILDMATLGLWEAPGTYKELNPKTISYKIEYDNNDEVKKITPLTARSKEALNNLTLPLSPWKHNKWQEYK